LNVRRTIFNKAESLIETIRTTNWNDQKAAQAMAGSTLLAGPSTSSGRSFSHRSGHLPRYGSYQLYPIMDPRLMVQHHRARGARERSGWSEGICQMLLSITWTRRWAAAGVFRRVNAAPRR
jgi:hypothetical protein